MNGLLQATPMGVDCAIGKQSSKQKKVTGLAGKHPDDPGQKEVEQKQTKEVF